MIYTFYHPVKIQKLANHISGCEIGMANTISCLRWEKYKVNLLAMVSCFPFFFLTFGDMIENQVKPASRVQIRIPAANVFQNVTEAGQTFLQFLSQAENQQHNCHFSCFKTCNPSSKFNLLAVTWHRLPKCYHCVTTPIKNYLCYKSEVMSLKHLPGYSAKAASSFPLNSHTTL